MILPVLALWHPFPFSDEEMVLKISANKPRLLSQLELVHNNCSNYYFCALKQAFAKVRPNLYLI